MSENLKNFLQDKRYQKFIPAGPKGFDKVCFDAKSLGASHMWEKIFAFLDHSEMDFSETKTLNHEKFLSSKWLKIMNIGRLGR